MPAKHCPRCTAELSADFASGLCPACLLEGGLEGSLDEGGRHPDTSFPQAFGEYDLREEIARGGQGVVYRARHRVLQREVALKMFPVHPWTHEADLRRFRREARIAAELDHPAIVPIYEIGEVSGQHYFTMKLIDGQGIDRRSSAVRPLRRVAEIIAEAARALQHAHERGVLHRDIKPGNVLIDAQGRPHLADFGIATLLEHEPGITRTRDVLGTPSYISPEAAAGDAKKISAATDVYGLGAVLYYLLTGHPPFAGDTMLEILRQVVEAEPRAPRTWNPEIDRDVEAICLKCLEKEPARRYATAADLAEDVERWLRHEPVRARVSTEWSRGRKWLRRNRRATIVTTAVALGFIALGWTLRQPARSGAAPNALAVVLRPADADSRYLAAEFSRTLIHLLGRIPGVAVAPRSEVLRWESSAESPQTVATAVRGPKLLFGTVRQKGDRLQLEFALLESGAAAPRWAKNFDVTLAASGSVHGQVARAVAGTLGISLPGGGGNVLRAPLTSNADAWSHYLRGRQLADTQSEPTLLQAIDEFQKAVDRDPDFAHAYAALADAHIDLGYSFREPASHFAQARGYVRAALQRDETLADALIAEGVLSYFLDWDWSSAERHLKRAMLLDSSRLENHGCYLHSLETVGRIEEALTAVRAAAAANPSSIMIQSELGCASYYAGKFEDAARYWRVTIAKDPENVYLRWGLARTLAQLQQPAEAERELELAQQKTGGDWAPLLAELAYVRGRQNHRDAALGIIDQLRTRSSREFVDPYLFAMAFAGLGEADAVFRELGRAVEVRSTWMPSLPIDPKFTSLRGDARFHELLARLKLPAR